MTTHSRTFNITISDNVIKPKITTKTLASAPVNKKYSASIEFTGSKLNTITAPNLPDGISIDIYGNISGIPTKAGKYTFPVTIANDAGQSTKNIKLAIFDIIDAIFRRTSREKL